MPLAGELPTTGALTSKQSPAVVSLDYLPDDLPSCKRKIIRGMRLSGDESLDEVAR